MSASFQVNTVTLDRLDRQIIHALQVEGRAPFARIAQVLEVSEQTVARRYRRLRGDGLVRVIGLVDPVRLGQTDWTVRVQCRPGTTGQLADALARRDDVSWVSVSAGGTEIVCSVRSPTREQRDDLLLRRLPNTSHVLAVSAHAALHRFLGMRADDWLGLGDLLDDAQIRRLRTGISPASTEPAAPEPAAPETSAPGPSAPGPGALEPGDRAMIDALTRDGRASYATLAADTGWSEGRVTRRLAALRASGTVFYDLDLAFQQFGFHATAHLWLTLAPADLDAVGRAIARHAETATAAAVTGTANLMITVVCRTADDLYSYITTRLGALTAIRTIEVVPVARQVKQAGSLLNGMRLADPAPPARHHASSPRSADRSGNSPVTPVRSAPGLPSPRQ
jgi:DNA-binding Lrp family transcriptional regulator